MSAQKCNRIKKYFRKRNIKKSEVFRVLNLIMEKQAGATTEAGTSSSGVAENYSNDFFNTGRIGRRNALPDILSYNCATTTADLPERLKSLSTDDSCNTGNNFSNSNASKNATPSSSSNYKTDDVNLT